MDQQLLYTDFLIILIQSKVFLQVKKGLKFLKRPIQPPPLVLD